MPRTQRCKCTPWWAVEIINVAVDDVFYTQESCGYRFKDGRLLDDLLWDLYYGRVDPLTCKTAHWAVEIINVAFDDVFYTQESSGYKFEDGRLLGDLLWDLYYGRVDPRTCKTLQIEVMKGVEVR